MRLLLVLLMALMSNGAAMAQSWAQLIGNVYTSRNSVSWPPEGNCPVPPSDSVSTLIIERIKDGKAHGKLTMEGTFFSVKDTRTCRYTSKPLSSEAEVEFSSRGDFTEVWTDSSGVARKATGTVQILNGGRTITLSSGGAPTVFHATEPFALAVPPPPPVAPYLVPARAADIVLQCRPISVANRSSATTLGSGERASTFQSSCQSTGWENERKSVQIWIQEGRCNGSICQIDERSINFDGISIDRVVGQYRDTCFVYQCERAREAIAPKKF